jgi:antitoxin component YwqK of YwqJK toxin-antitoxin module
MISSQRLFALFLISLALIGCCQNQFDQCYEFPVLTSINIIDRNGMTETVNNIERLEQYSQVDFLMPQPFQKVLRIYSRNAQGNIPSLMTSYHPNGTPWKYLEVINSRACGEYKEWYPNGLLRITANVLEGNADIVSGTEKTWIFDGCCQAWDEDGSLEATINYVKGNLEGVSLYFHSNGNIWKLIPYVHNAIHGTVEIFQSDGTGLETTSYCNGRQDGKSIRYWGLDQIAAEEEYCEGLLCTGRYYDLCGECVAEIDNGKGMKAVYGKESIVEFQEYCNGRMEGAVKQLDKHGRVTCLYHVKNGCKHGEEIYYNDASRFQKTLTPKLSIMWFEGNIQGIVKTWYENGNLESQREISSNKKNGHSTAWYNDGSLMLIEEYEQDQLLRGEYYNKGERYPVSIIEEGKGTATLFNPDGTLIRKIEYKNKKPVPDQ